MRDPDVIVVGAGPAGMAAAREAAEGGLVVLVLDEQREAGGQVYRAVASNAGGKPWLGKDYADGLRLVRGLDHPRIRVEFGATVWRIEAGPRVVWSKDSRSHVTPACQVLLAAGAQERPVPFPGWTLPGVMAAGAAQILMKSSGLLPRDAILAGSGPLIYLVAAQMIAAGAEPLALVETQTRAMTLRAAAHLPRALLSAGQLLKGVGLLRTIRAAGVVRYRAATGFSASATDDGGLNFSFDAGGMRHALPCRLLLTHHGVIPATNMTRAAGIPHEWNAAQQAWQPVADAWGSTTIPGLRVAGDAAGIGGALVAEARGRLAALDTLCALGKLTRDARDGRAAPHRATLRRALAIRPFLDAAYAPPPEFSAPPDATIVCRCEEITAGDIRRAAAEGAAGPRAIKTATRAGMGPCQGRMCDATVAGMLAGAEGRSRAGIGPHRARSPIKPVKLGELAALASDQEISA